MRLLTWMACAAIALPLLAGCGGGSSDSDNGAIRLVNASDDDASLDLYVSDSLTASAVATDAASGYAAFAAGSYTVKVKRNGSSTTASSSTRTVSASTAYTLVAYSTGDALRTVFFSDDESAPSSGSAKLRFFNGSIEAGALDVYVTTASATLADSDATVSALATQTSTSFSEFSAGSYRIRVTGAGDPNDLRLDLPSVTLGNQQVLTLVLTPSSSGVLVHGRMISQQSSVTAQRNPSARVRVVAGAAGNGTVAAAVNGTSLASASKSPSVGAYALVPAGSASFSASLDGASATVAATTLAAGSDNTLLVTGSAASPAATLITDDNKPAVSTSSTRLRLVHGVGTLGAPITLTADYSAIASDIAVNAASTPASFAAGSSIRLEATTPAASAAIYLATDVTLTAGHVYTLFMLGDAATPTGVLRRDR